MCVRVARLLVCTGTDFSIVALLEDEMMDGDNISFFFCFVLFCCETGLNEVEKKALAEIT